MNNASDAGPEPAWHLRSIDADPTATDVSLRPGERSEVTLGRDHDNDVVIPGDSYPYVSAHHARLYLDGELLILEDLASKNGTLVGRKRVASHTLHSGEVFQLGKMGPRFLVTHGAQADDTMTLDGLGEQDSSTGGSTIMRVRRALGLPRGKAVGDLLRARTRTQVVVGALLLLVMAAAVTVALMVMQGRSRQEVAALRELTDKQRRQLETKLERANDAIEAEHEAWRAQKDGLVTERDELQKRLGSLEKSEAASAAEISSLQERLAEASRRLASYDPINLEEARLRDVSRVAQAIVLVEITVVYQDSQSGKVLYVDESSSGFDLNTEDRGTPLQREATGSGFCVSAEGWIITNAHVVHPDELLEPLHPSDDVLLLPEPTINVVFTGSSERRPVQVAALADQGDEDLALLKITPFEGMPVIDTLDPDIETPPTGTEVFLYGFPLGKQALQAGDVVIASTFRGILSRVVAPYIQVDAGVHPGNSGGPLTDRRGRILGIVTGVQNTPEGLQTAIGYVLPVAKVRAIWPPPGS